LQPTKKSTIYDIANLAGTSGSTVSAVLNGTWKKRRISVKLADRISKIADELGYTLNMQASALRREKSGIIGMIVPMYDNRYFSSIAQDFEQMARQRGLFPIVTCTRRDPKLEMEAARAMLSYQVESLVCTGATDPDCISDLCRASGVKTFNLDLPGQKAPSVRSNNFEGAFALPRSIFKQCREAELELFPLLFVGGRAGDHNTRERLRGFIAAHEEVAIQAKHEYILTCGYGAEKSADTLQLFSETNKNIPSGMFVNSTITLEGIMRWSNKDGKHRLKGVKLGCFDWDPFAELLSEHILMVRQDVPEMLTRLFELIDRKSSKIETIEIMPIISPR
jgi:LacI family fructose operon transcriptional repressor